MRYVEWGQTPNSTIGQEGFDAALPSRAPHWASSTGLIPNCTVCSEKRYKSPRRVTPLHSTHGMMLSFYFLLTARKNGRWMNVESSCKLDNLCQGNLPHR